MSYQSKHTGAAIDAGIDAANAALPKSGGTMTGALILNANPTSNLGAVTKQYVDDAVGNIASTPGPEGKSAYQIALEHDFVGSEEEWLASLKGEDGVIGKDGEPGEDGISPSVEVESISGGHKVTITDATGPKSFEVMDGESGEDGENGVSPTVTVEPISGGHRVSVTDANGTQTFDVMNGVNGSGGDGSGDMSMSVYDTNGNGVVDDAEKLGGKTPDQYASATHVHDEYADAEHTHTEYADAEHTHDEYLTSYTETDPTVPEWAKAESKPSYTAEEVGAAPAEHDHDVFAVGEAGFVPAPTADDADKYLCGDGSWKAVEGGNAFITYGTDDLTAGTSELTDGEVYLVYE